MLRFLICTSFLALSTQLLAFSHPPIRPEVSRYTLLHDRTILFKDLSHDRHSSFFDLNLAFSSGLKKLISDVSDATRDDPHLAGPANTIQKQLNVYGLMTRHLNTENFLDAEASLAIPLPGIRLSKFQILPNPFFSLGAGSSFAFTNNEDYLVPKVQLYLRKEEKLGLRLQSLYEKETRFTLNLYQLKRSDVDFSMTNTELTEKGKIFDLKDLKRNEVFWASDLIFEREGTHSRLRAEVSELKFMSEKSKTQKKSRYGTHPLLKVEYERKNIFENTKFSPFFGVHYRSRYQLDEGLYLGFKMLPFDRLPFHFLMIIDNQFFLLSPQLKTKWFELIYSWRNPHQNPQKELWVPSQHYLEFHFPFS